MALQDYIVDMKRCSRCSFCKWIPYVHVKSERFAKGCPSIDAGKFHAYSGGGKLNVALALLENRIGYSDRLLDIVYKCQMCGSCDTSCKICRYMEPLQVFSELRAKCVEDGQLLPEHMLVIDSLRKEDNMMMKNKSDRGKWSDGLDVKNIAGEPAEVVFHAGCLLSYDEERWNVARTAVTLLRDAGVDVGIMGDIYRAALPFIFCNAVALALVIAFPAITLWLPSLMR